LQLSLRRPRLQGLAEAAGFAATWLNQQSLWSKFGRLQKLRRTILASFNANQSRRNSARERRLDRVLV